MGIVIDIVLTIIFDVVLGGRISRNRRARRIQSRLSVFITLGVFVFVCLCLCLLGVLVGLGNSSNTVISVSAVPR